MAKEEEREGRARNVADNDEENEHEEEGDGEGEGEQGGEEEAATRPRRDGGGTEAGDDTSPHYRFQQVLHEYATTSSSSHVGDNGRGRAGSRGDDGISSGGGGANTARSLFPAHTPAHPHPQPPPPPPPPQPPQSQSQWQSQQSDPLARSQAPSQTPAVPAAVSAVPAVPAPAPAQVRAGGRVHRVRVGGGARTHAVSEPFSKHVAEPTIPRAGEHEGVKVLPILSLSFSPSRLTHYILPAWTPLFHIHQGRAPE